jgi:polyisoprenoid-binding protein YceI
MSTTITTTELPLASGIWAVDPAHSSVEFTVRHLGLAKVRGRFDQFSGVLDVGATLAETSVRTDVELGSVDTNNADRDAHLASGDFFGAEANPLMTFRSTAITGTESDFELTGDLTIGGLTRSVTFATEFHGQEAYPLDGTTRAGFSATGRISRSDFGVSFDMPLGADRAAIGDKVGIELEIQVVAPR